MLQFSKDLNTFINSWKLNKSCKDNIITSTEQTDKTALVYDRECSKMFRDETSTLRYFQKFDPCQTRSSYNISSSISNWIAIVSELFPQLLTMKCVSTRSLPRPSNLLLATLCCKASLVPIPQPAKGSVSSYPLVSLILISILYSLLNISEDVN